MRQGRSALSSELEASAGGRERGGSSALNYRGEKGSAAPNGKENYKRKNGVKVS